MEIYRGKAVSPGIAFGSVYLLRRREGVLSRSRVQNPKAEWKRFHSARKEADVQLESLYRKACRELGESEALIIDVQRLMLNDGDFNDRIQDLILQEHYNAAYAVTLAGEEFCEFFAALEDRYMKARAADVSDVARRLTDILLGVHTKIDLTRPAVVVADELSPSETMQMDKRMIRGFVTRRGSSHSHMAILSRVMGIPAIVQSDIPMDARLEDCAVIVDGDRGRCYVEPDAVTVHRMQLKQKKGWERAEELHCLQRQATITKDGRNVRLYANISDEGDLQAVKNSGAEGIGLYRSEFLFLGRESAPSEEEQYGAYRKAVEAMDGKPVIIRTVDIGADKQADYLGLAAEANPALGYRGIRLCLDRPALLKTQLRAMYRASSFGKVGIMFPMITSLWEVRRCRELAEEVRGDLAAQGVPLGQVDLGIMVETPAAVMIADDLAREVDFFSVGTNDLIQYTLVVDRQNDRLEPYHDPRHPAVLRMLRMVARSAAKHGIWAGICGELASDTSLTREFLEMGYTELSVAPGAVLELRSAIRELDLSPPQETAAPTADEGGVAND